MRTNFKSQHLIKSKITDLIKHKKLTKSDGTPEKGERETYCNMKLLKNNKSINKSKILINKLPKGHAKAHPISHMDKVGIKQIPQTKKHR